MGHRPPPTYRPPTNYERVRASYVSGDIELEEFEKEVELLLLTDTMDRRWHPAPSSIRGRGQRWNKLES